MLHELKIAEGYDGLLYLAEAARNLQRLQSHRHAELELNVVVAGSITYVVEGRRFTFDSGTALWLFPSQEHQLVDMSPDARYYVAAFKPKLFARPRQNHVYLGLCAAPHGQGVLYARLKGLALVLVRKTLDSMMQGSLDPDLLNREAGYGPSSSFQYTHQDADWLNAGLHFLLLLCWRNQQTGSVFGEAPMLHPAVRKALKLLSDDCFDGSVRDLATLCGVSESYLSRTFSQQMGVRLARYRNSLRLHRFWEKRQESPEGRVVDAVYEAGFGSYAQFYRMYVQEYGKGPRRSEQPEQR